MYLEEAGEPSGERPVVLAAWPSPPWLPASLGLGVCRDLGAWELCVSHLMGGSAASCPRRCWAGFRGSGLMNFGDRE